MTTINIFRNKEYIYLYMHGLIHINLTLVFLTTEQENYALMNN